MKKYHVGHDQQINQHSFVLKVFYQLCLNTVDIRTSNTVKCQGLAFRRAYYPFKLVMGLLL